MKKKPNQYFERVILEYKSSSLGILKFRALAVKDIIYFEELLDKKLTNKGFSLKALFNQLDAKISYKEFLAINDSELRNILIQFTRKNKHIYKFYSTVKSPDEYYKFKKSIELFLDEQLKRILSLSVSVTKQLESAEKIILQSLAIPKITIPKIVIPALPKFTIPKFPKIDIPDFSKQLGILNDSFSKVIEKQLETWQYFDIEFKKISKKSLKNLKKYNWFINGSMPVSFIAETAKAKNSKEMKLFFINYHLYKNCKYLEDYLLDWKKNPLFKKRVKILSDTIKIFKENVSNKTVNINNIVIPVLINQIEGLRQDYLKSKGIKQTENYQWQDPKTKKTLKWSDFFNKFLKGTDEFTELTFRIFSDILFPSKNKKLAIINFNRHRISHGINTRYGTVETTIRCFMILEFISELP